MASAEVQLISISKVFGSVVAVDQLDLEVQGGEFFALLGPSGCGKTTTLRVIAGLEVPTSGEVYVRGRTITDVPPHKRNVGMVFQDYALFPHMTVFDNIAFGLRMKHWSKPKIGPRVEELLELIRLPEISGRYPNQLSGGQQQRVALARALAPEPAVLLLDEPLSNLDLKLRQQMRLELRRIQRELKITTIFVTHDQGEALSLADRIMVMREGRSVHIGIPSDVYMHPRFSWVASFLGDANSFRGVVKSDDPHEIYFVSKSGLKFPISEVPRAQDRIDRGESTIAIRPEAISLLLIDSAADASRYSVFTGYVENFAYVGSGTRYVIRLEEFPSNTILVDVSEPGVPWQEGTRLQVAFPRDGWVLLED